MYGIVKFGDKEIGLKATAATPPLFRRVFHFDLLNTLAKMRDIEDADEDTRIESGLDANELISKLGFIMAMQAKNADYSKLTIEDYYKWLDDFEVNAVNAAEIMNIYLGNTETTAETKK